MVQACQNLLHGAFQFLDVDHHPCLRIDLSLERHLDRIVMAVTVGICGLTEAALVLFLGPLRDSIMVGSGKTGPARQANIVFHGKLLEILLSVRESLWRSGSRHCWGSFQGRRGGLKGSGWRMEAKMAVPSIDYLVRATDTAGQVRILAARTTRLVEEARERHGTYPTVTAALGRVLTAAAIMG